MFQDTYFQKTFYLFEIMKYFGEAVKQEIK